LYLEGDSSGKEPEKLNIIGRSVVLAFRCSGIRGEFPSIVTVKELVPKDDRRFVTWNATKEERLKFFKGEKFGVNELRITGYRDKQISDWGLEGKKLAKRLIRSIHENKGKFIIEVLEKMDNGPKWCSEISQFEKKFIEDRIVEPMNKLITMFRELKRGKDASRRV
jgi:hypothetical protein